MKILICGDYIVHNNLRIKTQDIFGEFIDVIKKADIAIYNQEHPITRTSEIYSTKRFSPNDGCFPQAINPIIEAGFNFVSLSNNHIFNKGISGLNDTINFFKNHGIDTFGAGENIEEAKKIYYHQKKGFKVAFLNFAENEFNTATERHGGSNPLDIIDNVNQIREARENADLVFLIIHAGLEYCHAPTPRMVKQFRFYAENGASAIICHHSHFVSGYEIYKGCPIFYGIGNFIPAKPVKKFLVYPAARYSFPIQFELKHNGLEFTGFPLKFDYETFRLEYLKGKELEMFLDMQVEINSYLNDLDKLRKYILDHCLNIERMCFYLNTFTRSNYMLFKIFRKANLLKYYLRYMRWKMRLNYKNTNSWNLYRCETHKDVLDLIYDKYIDTYSN